MCDTMVVRSDDGLLFAKNSDRDPNEAQLVEWHDSADHPDHATVACTGMDIAQVRHTHAVLLGRPWWMWGAEMGANAHGVVIGNQAVFNRRGTAKTGLLGMDLVRLALERASSADDAVSVIVDLVETHGQGGACSFDHPGFRYDNSFLAADPTGAIVVETAGRAWDSESVTTRARSISNGYTIASFARAHADPFRARVAQAAARRCRTESAGMTATGPKDLFAALRDHGDSGLPRFRRLNGALSAPCAHAGGFAASTQTVNSWVSDLRGAPLHWVTATAAPCTSTFKPARVDRPRNFDAGVRVTNRFAKDALWWRHEAVHRLAMRDLSASLARFTPQRAIVEDEWVASPPEFDEALAWAEEREAAWYAELLAADLPETRPRRIARIARRDAAAAKLPASPPMMCETEPCQSQRNLLSS